MMNASLNQICLATLVVAFALVGSPALAFDRGIDLSRDLCEQRQRFDLNDVIARGDFVDVVRKSTVGGKRSSVEALLASAKVYGDNTKRQTVIVDGILMELPGVVIEGQIGIGAFIPVYPGTEWPIDRDDWIDELPCWANPDCPE